jgi:hypothetical protein
MSGSGHVENAAHVLSRSLGRVRTYFSNHPYKGSLAVLAMMGSMYVYEVNVVHRNQVMSLTGSVYETGSDEERARRRRVKAELVPRVSEGDIDQETMRRRVADFERARRAMEQQRVAGDGSHADPAEGLQASIVSVTPGHLQSREGTWRLRFAETNFSILAQDQFRQKDSASYRNIRSQDDDYGRRSA